MKKIKNAIGQIFGDNNTNSMQNMQTSYMYYQPFTAAPQYPIMPAWYPTVPTIDPMNTFQIGNFGTYNPINVNQEIIQINVHVESSTNVYTNTNSHLIKVKIISSNMMNQINVDELLNRIKRKIYKKLANLNNGNNEFEVQIFSENSNINEEQLNYMVREIQNDLQRKTMPTNLTPLPVNVNNNSGIFFPQNTNVDWKIFVDSQMNMFGTNYSVKVVLNAENKVNQALLNDLLRDIKKELHREMVNQINTSTEKTLKQEYKVEIVSSNDNINKADVSYLLQEIQSEIKQILSNINFNTNNKLQNNFNAADNKLNNSLKHQMSISDNTYMYQEALRLLQQERFEQAILQLDAVLMTNPNDPAIHYNKGYALSQLGRYDDAILSYDRVISLDSNNFKAYNDKGFAYECKRNFNEAINWYKLALEKNPNSAVARNNLSNMQMILDKQREPVHIPSNQTGQYDVMISYSWKDQKEAFNLYNLLTNQGFKCWIDKNEIYAGSLLYDELMNAVLQSKVILLCISKSYLQSDNCYREFYFAQQNKKKESIVPIKFGDFEVWPPNHKIFFLLADTVRIENIYKHLLNPLNTHSNEASEFIQQLRWKLNNNNM